MTQTSISLSVGLVAAWDGVAISTEINSNVSPANRFKWCCLMVVSFRSDPDVVGTPLPARCRRGFLVGSFSKPHARMEMVHLIEFVEFRRARIRLKSTTAG